jgi:exodeoxyribonuclease VII large subunit
MEMPIKSIDTTKENPWPLSVYSQNFGKWVAAAPPAWIEAEITKASHYPSGSYITFKDLTEQAFLPASSFDKRITMKLKDLEEGARVVTYIKPSFWTKKGQLSMSIYEIDAIGAGDMLQKIEELKKKLFAEGLFDDNLKKPLPFLPRVIGLICGKGAQAKDDVLENVRRRWPSQKFEIREVSVGNSPKTPKEVSEALDELGNIDVVDVIVIARGGGALEEVVFPFSDEDLVRNVAQSQTPVVSAIGHETDCPILDLVADYRASTPTDAAKNVVPNLQDEVDIISQLLERSNSTIGSLLDNEARFIDGIRSRPILSKPESILDPLISDLSNITQRLNSTIAITIERASKGIETLISKLDALNPTHTLKRGYSLSFVDGLPLTSVSKVKIGQEIKILLSDGEVRSDVRDITNNKEKGM